MRSQFFIGAILIAGCATESSEPPAVYFKNYYGSSYDSMPFDTAWTAARDQPELGVAYTFPVLTVGIASGSEVRLIAGRSTEDPRGPLTTGDDVIIQDEALLATAKLASDGTAAFPPLSVATGAWTSGTGSIPAALLCGTTVIAARAYDRGDGEVPATRFLASTFIVAASAPCP